MSNFVHLYNIALCIVCVQDSVAEVVEAAMKKNRSASGIIIDGFPRNKDQLELFNRMVSTFLSVDDYWLFDGWCEVVFATGFQQEGIGSSACGLELEWRINFNKAPLVMFLTAIEDPVCFPAELCFIA